MTGLHIMEEHLKSIFLLNRLLEAYTTTTVVVGIILHPSIDDEEYFIPRM